MNSIVLFQVSLFKLFIILSYKFLKKKNFFLLLASDGRVIVYGGLSISKEIPVPSALPQLAVLDTSKTPYTWSTPVEENSGGALSEHSAVMINNYMILAFGKYSTVCLFFT